MERLLRDTYSPIKLTIRDGNGTLTDVDAETSMPVRVYDSAGVKLQDVAGATKESAGVYKFTPISAVMETLDVYRVEWDATIGGQVSTYRTEFEVVGGLLFGIAAVRGLASELANTTNYPSSTITDVREIVEDGFEEECNVSFRPRGRRISLDGVCDDTILLPDLEPTRIVAASIDGVALDVSKLTVYPDGRLHRSEGSWSAANPRGVAVFYEYGLTTVPSRVRRAGLIWAKVLLTDGKLPERVTSYTTEDGSFELSGIGEDRPTGIPEVDRVILAERRFKVAIR